MRVPVQLQRAMAAEAEAAREARAKVVAAEGEQKASLHLKEAALVLEESTSALQLRYLQVRWPHTTIGQLTKRDLTAKAKIMKSVQNKSVSFPMCTSGVLLDRACRL